MWNRTNRPDQQLKASWRRELLQPLLISLAPIAYAATMLDLLGDYSLLVLFLILGTACLPLLIPELMVAGSKLHRPNSAREEDPVIVISSPLQSISDGEYGPKNRDDYEGRIPLPEIDTALPSVQKLIATLGAPGPLHQLPRRLKTSLEPWLIVAAIVIAIAFLWWLDKQDLSNAQKLWVYLAFTGLILVGAYRSAFRRLYDIYTADAAKTGRHAFPAIHR
ncbi:hypothetical protein [Brevundimonas sp.]|uniref:hypothetical protein n=1 Tax=Brevundimonas sp. TaxID=1871086 RepID=UPI00289D64C1|nr:hypothetical protein [Brevundimonas sp.]